MFFMSANFPDTTVDSVSTTRAAHLMSSRGKKNVNTTALRGAREAGNRETLAIYRRSGNILRQRVIQINDNSRSAFYLLTSLIFNLVCRHSEKSFEDYAMFNASTSPLITNLKTLITRVIKFRFLPTLTSEWARRLWEAFGEKLNFYSRNQINYHFMSFWRRSESQLKCLNLLFCARFIAATFDRRRKSLLINNSEFHSTTSWLSIELMVAV